IQFDQAATEALVDNCEFNMGGFHILTRTASDQLKFTNNRFKNSRAEALSLANDGECQVFDNYFIGCCTASSAPDGVVRVTTISAHGGGIVHMKGNRIKNWTTGY